MQENPDRISGVPAGAPSAPRKRGVGTVVLTLILLLAACALVNATLLQITTVTVIGNRIEGGYPGGVYAVNSSVLSLSGNSFDGCRAAGITLLGCYHCSATANMTRIHGQRAEGDENCHIRMEYCRDCVLTGNTSWCWYQLLKQREDVKTGPLYGLVLRGLTRCVVSGNALHECCHIDPVRDYGGHTDTLIEHNMGQAFDLATLA